MPLELQSVLFKIYSTISDPMLYTSALDETAHFVGANSIAIFDENHSEFGIAHNVAACSSSFLKLDMIGYSQQHHEQEALDRQMAKTVVAHKTEIEVLSDEVTYNDYNEYLSRPNIQHLRDRGMRHRAIAFLSKDNLARAHFTLQFSDDRGPITPEETRKVEVLVPHLSKAFELGRLIHGDKLANDTLDFAQNSSAGLCIVDQQQHVVFANGVFEHQMYDTGAFKITPFGKMEFARPQTQTIFVTALSNLQFHAKYQGRPRKGARYEFSDVELCIEISPLVAQSGSNGNSKFLITCRNVAHYDQTNLTDFAREFALSPAEKEITRLILSGCSNAEIAERRNRSISTIKSQLDSLFSKTLCRNRAELVRLAMIFS